MAPSKILVVGATGKQGSAVLSQLAAQISSASSSSSSSPSSSTPAPPKILALTRSSASAKAQALLTSYPTLDLDLVEGNNKDPGPIFAAHPDITSVFSYTTPPAEDEEAQATALIDAAAASDRCAHFVFSSVDRGGDARSWESPTDVPHFASKHRIELHLRSVCERSTPPQPTAAGEGEDRNQKGRLTYTILRPTAFMDNLNPGGAFGRVFASLWWTLPADRPLQLVSVRDIGAVAARALLRPERYAGRAVSLAGDELTYLEARSVFRRATDGAQLPQAWGVVGYGVRWAVKEVGSMFRWFETDGYGVDVEKLKREEEGMQDLETWLRESSLFDCVKGGGDGRK
ncbi:NAD(P)-binding protein [Xylariomycetidae sp. FL2044]|nr:NAD(P)-binding protein [Xylariomycetidae sp. FL2044]